MPGPHPEPLAPQVARADAATRFRALHDAFFVMPNPFDAGTARLLAHLGFPAIATSSAGLAWRMARCDREVTRDQAIAHAVEIAEASGLPVNGDFEAGYGETPAEMADLVTAAIDAGVAGCSIEDLSRARPEPLYDLAVACRRIEAAREAIERAGSDFVLTGRCEAFLAGVPDALSVAVERLAAYENAGAHVVYAPGMKAEEEVRSVLEAVSVPLNVIGGVGGVSDDLDRLKALGVRRISIGSGLAKVALGAFQRAAEALAAGRVEFAGALPYAAIEAAMKREPGAA